MIYLGLVFQFLLFLVGFYVYLFSRGAFRSKDPRLQARAEQFRRNNGRWLRIMGLALMAIMLANLFLGIRDLIHAG